MHKKHSRLAHKDHHHGSTKRGHVKAKKGTDDSTLEIMKVPQNSKNELTRKFGFGDYEIRENLKSTKHKHKHKKDDGKSSGHQSKNNHEKKSVEQRPVDNEPVSRKEKKEKREKERLNKIEKYLEGISKVKHQKRNRSLSLESSQSLVRNQHRHLRRENTFDEKLRRNSSTNSRPEASCENISQIPTSSRKRKSTKKHRKEYKNRESSKDKNSRENEKPVMYCEIQLQNSFLKGKKNNLERLYPKESNTDKDKVLSPRDGPYIPQMELLPKSHKDKKHLKEKKATPIKFSPRKAKAKADRIYKDPNSNASLGLYNKHFVPEKRSQKDKEIIRNKKKKHQKMIVLPRKEKRTEDNIKPEKSKKPQEKVGSDQYKAKIEDDIKTYFCKIQTLIDKKLDFILGNNKPKDVKVEAAGNDLKADKVKKKKEKSAEIKEDKPPRSGSPSKNKNSNERHKRREDRMKAQRLQMEMETNRYEEERKIIRESRRLKDASSTSLRRERYPSAQSEKRSRQRSPQQYRRLEDHEPACDMRRHKLHKCQHKESKLSPDRLIDMLEHPSKFSVQSNTSLNQEKSVSEVKQRRNDEELDITKYYQYRDASSSRKHENQNNAEGVCSRRTKGHTYFLPEDSKTTTKENLLEESKHKPHDICTEISEHHHQRGRNLVRRHILSGEDDFHDEEIISNLPEAYNKKLKKRMRQLMNLECKTISIVGIPSQIRESTIFNGTQTTTSLNAINPVEDFMEQKKKSKRFKLYYKYSVADNKCPLESDKSSEGKKSIISDSLKMVSDPSEQNMDVLEEQPEEITSKESEGESEKILFVMKKGKVQRNCGDMSRNRPAVEHISKKYRKRGDSPKQSILNNILEEPSNISIAVHHNKTSSLSKNDVNCTFFNSLKSSTSDCNMLSIKKSVHNSSNIDSVKHKNYSEKHVKGSVCRPRSSSRRSCEKSRQREDKAERRHTSDERRKTTRVKKIESHQKLRKKRGNVKDMYKYNSKSDINISYDSLIRHKYSKEKHKSDVPSQFREQLKELLPELFIQKPSDEVKNIGSIIKEELREIIKEIPICKNPNLHDLEIKPKSKYVDQEVQEIAPYEKPTVQDSEEKQFSSKKIGTQHATSKIPSLIKGYVRQQTQMSKEESIEIQASNEENNQIESINNLELQPREKNLVDVATEVSISKTSVEKIEKREIALEHKMSQTPSISDKTLEVTEPSKGSRHSKKLVQSIKPKDYKIMNPFTNTKIACISKPTRPILNVENNNFPSRKAQESRRPTSGQCKRQKSSLSEGRSMKFLSTEKTQSKISKSLERRPATTEDNRRRTSQTLLEKNKKKSTKATLTMSTNVITISTSVCAEKSTETCDIDVKGSKMDIKDKSTQRTYIEKIETEDLSSKSAPSLNESEMESRICSLVCMDKFNSLQRFHSSTNSFSKSLDHYTTNTIMSENIHPSRLFLTKDYIPQMNTYQRRKMYDENIRRKMKKRLGSQNQMGPRVYEVRYLTLEKDNLAEGSDVNSVVTQKYVSKLPTFNTKINKMKSKIYKPSSKSKRNFPKNKEDACKYSGRDIFAPVITDVDQLNRFRRKAFPEKKIEEIFINGNSTLDSIQSSSLVIKNDDCTDEDCKIKQSDSGKADDNIKGFIDSLYNSILSYCDANHKPPENERQNRDSLLEIEEKVSDPKPINEKSYVIFPKPSDEVEPDINELLKKNSSAANINVEEAQWNRSINLTSGHLSCPVLAGSASSFDYLYEDGSIEVSKEAVLLHLRKPLKTILGYALNTTPTQNRTQCFDKKTDQVSTCATESEESGYSSNNSKKCTSVCSFFKRPSIAHLFKPVKKLEALPSSSTLNDSRSGPNLIEYNVMNQKCVEYAEKVRMQTRSKEDIENTFQEIPLDVLLNRRSSTLLRDFNSNCSLCKKCSKSDLPDIVEENERSRSDIEDSSTGNEIQGETLIFYEDIDHRQSLEIITFKKSQNNTTQLVEEVVERPLVLSVTNLNSCSLTMVEDRPANDGSIEANKNEIVIEVNAENLEEGATSSPFESDEKSEISSSCGFRCTPSPTEVGKVMAKHFFENLLKVYEKEINVTNKLFRDDDFFVNVLLESVKTEEALKTKNVNFSQRIKGKIKNYIGNVFLPKSEVCNGDAQSTDSYNSNHQRKLQTLAGAARKYFSMYVQAVRANKDINDEMKVCGLLKLLERIEDGDFAILRKKEEVDFEEEIKEQVKEAFVSIYQISMKEAKKRRRMLTENDLNLIRTFVSKYRIGFLSKTDLIASYIGKGIFKTEGHLRAAVTYLIQQNKNKNIDLKDFDEHCKVATKCVR